MTTVSENFPSTTSTYDYLNEDKTTNSTVCKNGIHRNRYSSGANRPKKAYVKQFSSYENSRIVFKTKAGKTTTSVVHYQKIRSYRKLNNDDPRFSEPHPYTRQSYKAVYSPYLATSLSYGKLRGSWNNPNEFWYFQSTKNSFGANDQIALINKLGERLRGTDFDIGVSLAELPLACSMIYESALKIGKAIRSFKKGKAIDAWNHLTGSKPYKRFGVSQSSTWLELQYGWLPLLKDAHDGAEFLAHHLSDVPRPKKYRVSHKAISLMASSTLPGSEGFAKSSHVIRRSIVAEITENRRATLIGQIDPLTVAWELVPFSFVVDWFIPIGNYLSARGLASSLSGVFVTTTVDRQLGRSWRRLPAGGTSNFSGGLLDVDILSVTRSISTSLSVDMPQVKPLAKIASWTRAANAVSILTQNLGTLDQRHFYENIFTPPRVRR